MAHFNAFSLYHHIYVEVSSECVEASGRHSPADGVKVVGEGAETDGGIVVALQ